MLAPVVLFTYNRYEETKRCINSLLNSSLVGESEIFIFSDGSKNNEDFEKVFKVREYLKSINGFKKINFIFKEKNEGLANSIIKGVTEIINQYGKVIVLEDDLIVAPDFLEYMNEGLNIYEGREDIWSISGYTPPLKILKNIEEDIYLTQRGCSWGWGTWEKKWNENSWDLLDFESLRKDRKRIEKFNKSGNDMFKMLELQKLNRINSWAIRWGYNQFKLNKWTVYPKYSKILNEGFGIGATHGGVFIEKFQSELDFHKIKFLKNVMPREEIILAFKKHNDLSIAGEIGYFLRKYNLFYKQIKRLMLKIRGRKK